jgi:hypothetical protein
MNSRRFIASPKPRDPRHIWLSTQAIKTGNGIERNGEQCGNLRCKNSDPRMSVVRQNQ